MPFSDFQKLPSAGIQVSAQHFSPISVPVRYSKLQAAGEAISALPAILKPFSPEEKMKDQLLNLEYHTKLAQFNYLQQHPNLLGGKTALDNARLQNVNASTSLLNTRADALKNPTSKLDPVVTSYYQKTFGGTPPVGPEDTSLTVPQPTEDDAPLPIPEDQPIQMPDLNYDSP